MCMKNIYNGRGFTLIELLVVVLIIGILASVALPQYEKAVAKSRAAGYMATMKPLSQAAQVCYLAVGDACSIDDLDVEAPACKPLPETYQCNYSVIGDDGATVRVAFFVNGQMAKSPTFFFALNKAGQRVCYGGAAAELCPKYGFKNIDTSLAEEFGVEAVYVEGKVNNTVVIEKKVPIYYK